MKNFFNIYGTGILLAATGVGAGDLITSGLAGIHHGKTLIWACILGGVLKYFLNEGLTRYQMATGETLLAGWVGKIQNSTKWIFLSYLIIWSFFVGGALINACGVAATNIYQVFDNYHQTKIFYGVIHSFAGLFIVLKLKFGLLEKVMSFFVFIMFISVILTASLLLDLSDFSISYLFVPKINESNLSYAVAVMGGVGGTLTIMSYSYWLMEKNRVGFDGLQKSRKDLKLSYFLTVLFSIAMIIIGSHIPSFEGPKSLFPVHIADIFQKQWGEIGRYLFLIGFYNGVFSSLLGVWQSVPYIFTDLYQYLSNSKIQKITTKAKPYRIYAILLSTVPLISLWIKFEKIQLTYAVVGALFMPLLSLSLIYLTNKKWMKNLNSNLFQNLLYFLIFLCFIYFGYLKFI